MSGKLIIGAEDTPQGRDAVVLGGLLAEVLAETPTIATVVPYPENLLGREDLEAALRANTADLFAGVKDRLKAVTPETQAVASPSPARALYELAEAEDASLIVVGSTHRGPLGRVLPGSVGERLLQGAPCAVAVAPRGYAEREHQRLLHVGVAFDGSAEAWAALETGVGLAQRIHAAMTVVVVAEPVHQGYGTTFAVLTASEYQSYEKEGKHKALRLALDRVPAGLPVRGSLLEGDAANAIAEAAEDFDLLVIGSRGYGPLRRTLLGGISAKVIRTAPCPVLVLPRAAGVDPLGLDEAADATAARREATSAAAG